MKHTVSLFSLSNPKGTKDQVQMMKDARRIASEIGPGGSFLTAVGSLLISLDWILQYRIV